MNFEETVQKCFRIILIVLCLTQLIITEQNRCNSSLCNCSRYIEDEYRYQNVISCPQTNSIVRFEIMNYTDESYINQFGHPFIKAFIHCDTDDQLVYDVIAQTNVEYFDSVQYIKCPVPFNLSLGHGMPILAELIFDNDGSTKFNDWKSIHFSELTNLKELDLETETMDQLPNDTFAASSKLKEVNLKMKHPNLNLFPSAEIFQIGGVDGDGFTTNALGRNLNLKSVNLYGSKFKRLTNSALEGFKELKVLTLYGNEIMVIDPDCFDSLINLEKITFGENKIKNFPAGVFSKNKKLRKISIQFGQMKTLPNKVFGDLPELDSVSLSDSDLEIIPNDIFEKSLNIESVEFFSIQIRTLPIGLFDNLPKLKEIRILRNSQLKSLPHGLFDKLSNLQVLNLAGNQFKSISAANIKVASPSLFIDFSLNQIEDVTVEDLAIFEKNTTVHLGFNKIARFSGIVQLRQHLDRYNSTVLMRENPFNCSTCDVFHIVQERSGEYDDPDDFVTKPFSIDTFALKCSEPVEFYSKSVRHLDLTNYDCELTKGKIE